MIDLSNLILRLKYKVFRLWNMCEKIRNKRDLGKNTNLNEEPKDFVSFSCECVYVGCCVECLLSRLLDDDGCSSINKMSVLFKCDKTGEEETCSEANS